MRITPLGWSGFRIDVAERSVLIDAHHGGFQTTPSPPPRTWGRDADLLVVSHGHFDHCGVLPELVDRNPHAQIVSAEPVRSYAHDRWGIPTSRLVAPPWGDGEVRVEYRRGVHVARTRIESTLLAAKWMALRPRSMSVLRAQSDQCPGGAPVHAIRLVTNEGTVVHAAEVLHRGSDFRAMARWSAGETIDVLLAGVEPTHELAVLRAITVLRPRSVVLFSPHQATRDWFDGPRARRPDMTALASRARALTWAPMVDIAQIDTPARFTQGERDAA
ncbi:MAG: MBL fold metallo-hydrolase [Proteobacteria bacterium]|nr:MBL fold metallo-hydrolase [Pseudomonadota bacterium]